MIRSLVKGLVESMVKPLVRDDETAAGPIGDGLLTEGGDFLVTESGDYIVTE